MEIRINIVGPLVLGGILTRAAQWCNCFLSQEMRMAARNVAGGTPCAQGLSRSRSALRLGKHDPIMLARKIISCGLAVSHEPLSRPLKRIIRVVREACLGANWVAVELACTGHVNQQMCGSGLTGIGVAHWIASSSKTFASSVDPDRELRYLPAGISAISITPLIF